MTVEITISQAIGKMQELLARNDIMYLPELKTRFHRSITSLTKSYKFLEDLEDGHGNTSTTNRWKTELRKAVYNTENEIDSFLVRTALTKASPILYLTSLSDQVSLNKKMEKIVDKLEKLSKQIGEDTSEPNIPDGQSDQEQAKPSADMGASSSNNLGDQQLQPSAKSKTFGEDTSQPIISNGRPESDQEQPKLSEDTWVQPTDLRSNNLGDVGEVTSEQNMSDGRPSQEQTKLPQTDLSSNLSDVKQLETKNAPEKRFQRSETMYDDTKMVGLEDELRELTELTLNGNAKFVLISIVGKEGSGKTFLVRQIFNKSQTRQNFKKLAFISVSQNFKKREILAEILQQVAGLKDQVELPFEVLQQKLHDFLAQKRYLIVLDDVHKPDVWNEIKLAFPESGSRVILTIRDAKVARCIDPSIVLLPLPSLTDEESWILFTRRVKKDISKLPEDLKQEILHKCQGLPLQILVLGGVLAPKDPAEWSEVLNQFKRRSAPPTDLPVISEIIKEDDEIVVSDRNSMTSSRLRRATSILGDETKYPPGKRFLQRSETLSLYDETKIVLVKDKLEELSQLTLNRYAMYFLISVVGRAGSGKTLLVRQIFNHSQTKQNFEKLAFISVSQNFKEREILAEILQQVAGVKDQEKFPFEVLQQKLRDFLARKRYLIVLDDVHTPDVWNKIKLAFPNSLKGSRVILTIRDANVARRIAPTIVLLHLRPLTNEESWKLFLTRVKMKEDIRTLPDSIKQEILHKCQGLPLQILALGDELASREINPAEWAKVLNQIQVIGKEEKKETNAALDEDQSNSPYHSVSEDSLDPLNFLDLGFQDLSSTLMECLHYLCLFPKSREIRTRRLFQLWFAEGLAVIPKKGDANATEDAVERYIEDLVQRNMIDVVELRSNGKPKTCRVLDTVYDKFISDAADLGYHHIHGNPDSTSKSPNSNIRRLGHRIDPLEKLTLNHINLEDVRSYICFYNQKGERHAEEVGKFINNTFNRRGFGLLTVLDLEGVYKPVLPKTLGKVLPLLKYVGLRWTFLDSIPESVGDLQYLETLDVKHTNITTLPISIWKAKELQHLYMNEIYFEMSIRESSLRDYPTKLQTLWGLLIGNKNPPPIELLNELKSIRKLGLTCHTESLKKLTSWISGLTGLRSLRLRAINEFSEPSGIHLRSMVNHKKLTDLYLLGKLPKAIDIKELPPNLTNLTLSVSKLSDDPMKMLGQLAELKVLKLLADSYTGKDMTCLHDGFPKLKVLKLWMLKELEKWIIEQGSMPELKELEIRYCPKLLNKPEGLEYLTKAEVTLTNMKEDFNNEVEKCLGKVNKINHVFNPSWD